MMYCEICGKKIKEAFKILVEGSEMFVCSECKKFGKVIKDESKLKGKTSFIESENEEFNVCAALRKIMEERKLGIEEIAKKLNMKESTIRLIIEDKLVPSEEVVKKIERVFKVKVEKRKAIKPERRKSIEELTVGDVIELK